MSEVPVQTGWSADGLWFWDGWQWKDAVSPDGKWRFDGKDWKRFKDQRTPMPTEPLHALPPPLPPQPAAVEMPSWVATSEIDRLEKERQERAMLAAAPVLPPPPELDWRQAGHYIEHSRTVREYKDWQVGPTSVAYFIISYLTCWPLSLVFTWRTGWRFRTKVLVSLLSVIGPVVVAFLAIGSGLFRRS
jgi:hypothetical protein